MKDGYRRGRNGQGGWRQGEGGFPDTNFAKKEETERPCRSRMAPRSLEKLWLWHTLFSLLFARGLIVPAKRASRVTPTPSV